MTEIWSPENNQTDEKAISNTVKQLLDKILNAIKQPGDISKYNSLIDSISHDRNLAIANIAKQELSFWQNHLENHSEQDIIIFIEFFTLAEEAIATWQFGANSPVIDCAKILKQRGCKLEKDVLLWIKSHSTNKFLPYGPL